MHSKIASSLLLINLLLVTFIPFSLNAEELNWWDDNWSYRTQIIIPFDTNEHIAKYQPIDTIIEFNNPCWAKNTQEHSIRVIFQYKDEILELESQIYDLNYIDDVHIQSCSIVFLIPKEANGKEVYYIYYDESQKPSANYIDHVEIEESYYRYEPISGYPLTSQYYKITQDGYIPYAISLEGEIMGYYTSQHVTKLKDNITEVMPKNGELFAAFNFRYYYGQGLYDLSSTSQCLISKEIIVNGNLMVEFGIVSTSDQNDIQTTAIYKYYFCPSDDKRLHVHVVHEALKELEVDENINNDGIFAIIQSGGISSSTIKDLNVGEILPYLHTYTEHDTIEEYHLDLDPDYIPENPSIQVLCTEDDVDVGEKTWGCFDYGEVGVSHAIIFSSNQVIKSGLNERDGIQIKASEMDYPHLPGIENDMATVTFGRNSYESGGIHDRLIPDDFVVEFDAEFFSSKTGGYTIVSNETEIFQRLVEIKPSYISDFDEETQDLERYDLTVFAHLSPSFPMGSALSALIGRNFSYINAELYRDDEFIISGAMGRLLLKPLPDLTEKSKIGQIITVLSSFDFRNFTFVKKFSFQNLLPGRYVVKIFKENQLLGSDRKYVGYQIINVSDDTKTRILCRPQGSIKLSIIDQNKKPVVDAKVFLLQNEQVISKCNSDEDGLAIIFAPAQFGKKYDLRVVYNGIIVFEDSIKLSFFNSIFPIKTSIDIQSYDFFVNVFDTWDLISEIKLTPKLINNNEKQQITIFADNIIDGQYHFKNIPAENYQLKLQYKSFSVEKDISIPTDDIKIVFPAEFNININAMDSRGASLSDVMVVLSRINKNVEKITNHSGASFLIPPGTYNAKIYNDDDLIGARKINVQSQRSFDIITKTEPIIPLIITIIAIILILFGFILSYVRKDYIIFLKIIAISLIIIAIVSPWWILNGSNSNLETSTTMYLFPIKLVTTTTYEDVISGELASLPQVFIDVISVIPIISILSALLLAFSLYFRKKHAKIYFVMLLFILLMCIFSIIIFSIGTNELAEVGIGSFIGEKSLEVSIPGEEFTKTILCNWGPSNGYYIYLISMFIIVINIFYTLKDRFKKDI